MDHLESSLRREGAWDSSGAFTLDNARALEKMSRFALSDPRRYVLNLVSWGVASQATRLDFTIGPGRLELVHDGTAPDPAQLRDLFANFAGQGLACQELAIAAQAASLLPGSTISIHTAQAGLRFTASLFEFHQQPSAQPNIKFSWHQPGQTHQWFNKVLGRSLPEESWLKSLACFADIPIRINGHLINEAIPLPQWRAGVLVGPGPKSLLFDARQESRLLRQPSHDDLSLFLAQGSVPLLATPCLYLVRGVRFELPTFETNGESLVVVVHAPSLRKDLSQSQLVMDAHIQAIQARLTSLSRLSIFEAEENSND